MEKWIPYLLGPGGALVILLLVGWKGYNFFTSELARLNERYAAQEKRLIILHEKTLETMSAQTGAIEKLSVQISSCMRGGK